MPVPGKPTVVCLLFLPIVYLKPRVPNDIDIPLFDKFSVMPGSIFILFQSLKLILPSCLIFVQKRSIVKVVNI